MENSEKKILVTGSSRGIGKAIALDLGKDGYNVVLHCRSNVDKAQAVCDEIRSSGTKASVLSFDITEREQCREVLEKEINDNGAFYGMVLNAGIHKDNPFPALTEDEWDSVIDTNLRSLYNVIKPALMPMVQLRKGGRIVTISSVSGLIGNRGQVNYSAAKAGIIGATKALALEMAKRKITVNCVVPGIIDTDMIDEVIREEAMKLVPMKRFGQPEEIAAMVAFLISEKASYITRQIISVNGGMI